MVESQEDGDKKICKARAERIRQARKDAVLTQQGLADKSGISKAMIAQWETGIRRPGVDALQVLARTLDVPFSWLAIGESCPGTLDPDIRRRLEMPQYSPTLLRDCVEMIVEAISQHNIPFPTSNLPTLIDDLYQRAAAQGLDKESIPKDKITRALKSLVKIYLAIST